MRFSEFNVCWTTHKLEAFAKIYDGTHQTPKYTKSGIRFISVENISNLYDSQKFISLEDFKKEFKIHPQINDILMTRIGDIGTPAVVSKEDPLAYYVSLALIRPLKNLYYLYIYDYIQTPYFKKELWHRTLHIAFPQKINKEEIGKCKISIPCEKEQFKIGSFLSLIDQRINTQSKIIEDLECQINYIRRKLFTGYINDDIYNQKYIFNKIFISYKKLNEQSLQQYTIGKNGIKSMSNHLNYSINSHIVFMPNTLILGIGIDEIGVSIDTTGCCSPIYKTYKINNEIVDTLFLNIFANDYFSIIKNRVTQKSTRREFEFDYKELAKTLFTLPDIETQKRDAQIVNKFFFKLQKEKDILELYKKQKAYLLKNMFI